MDTSYFGSQKFRIELGIQLLIFSALFLYFILQPAIISPDTQSYLIAKVYRYPGYVGFLYILQFLFGTGYETVAVGVHLLFSFAAIRTVFKNITSFLNFRSWTRWLLFAIFLIPFFPPLSIANNLTSEGISYPLYLLVVSFGIDLLFRDIQKRAIPLAIVFLLLSLTRGQFVVLIPIIAFMYILKHKKSVFKRSHLVVLVLLLCLPVISRFLDSSYRKLKHDFFVPAPFSYVTAITLPIYVSGKDDHTLMKDEAHAIILRRTYSKIQKAGLLSSQVEGNTRDKYLVFHQKFPKICNQGIHKYARDYYYDANARKYKNFIDAEIACKEMFPILLKANFKEWFKLFMMSLTYGFGHITVFVFMVLTFIISFFLLLKQFKMERAFLFFASSLVLSNAMIIAFAAHSIQRYLFYNYFIGFIILILVLRKLIKFYESRTVRGHALPE